MVLATSIIVVLGNDLLSPKRHMKAMFRRGKGVKVRAAAELYFKSTNFIRGRTPIALTAASELAFPTCVIL